MKEEIMFHHPKKITIYILRSHFFSFLKNIVMFYFLTWLDNTVSVCIFIYNI